MKRKYLVQTQAYRNNKLLCFRVLTNSWSRVEAEIKHAESNDRYYTVTDRHTGKVIKNTYPTE